MAIAKYSNALDLFNLTVKSVPTSADLFPIGDVAVTGTPLKQATLGSIPFVATNNAHDVVLSTQAMAINQRYYVDYTGGVCTLTLPAAASSPLGSYVEIRGGEAASNPFVVAQNALQTIRMFGNLTTAGVTGSLTMPGNYGSLRIECDDPAGTGLTWTVVDSQTQGSIGLT